MHPDEGDNLMFLGGEVYTSWCFVFDMPGSHSQQQQQQQQQQQRPTTPSPPTSPPVAGVATESPRTSLRTIRRRLPPGQAGSPAGSPTSKPGGGGGGLRRSTSGSSANSEQELARRLTEQHGRDGCQDPVAVWVLRAFQRIYPLPSRVVRHCLCLCVSVALEAEVVPFLAVPLQVPCPSAAPASSIAEVRHGLSPPSRRPFTAFHRGSAAAKGAPAARGRPAAQEALGHFRREVQPRLRAR